MKNCVNFSPSNSMINRMNRNTSYPKKDFLSNQDNGTVETLYY